MLYNCTTLCLTTRILYQPRQEAFYLKLSDSWFQRRTSKYFAAVLKINLSISVLNKVNQKAKLFIFLGRIFLNPEEFITCCWSACMKGIHMWLKAEIWFTFLSLRIKTACCCIWGWQFLIIFYLWIRFGTTLTFVWLQIHFKSCISALSCICVFLTAPLLAFLNSESHYHYH